MDEWSTEYLRNSDCTRTERWDDERWVSTVDRCGRMTFREMRASHIRVNRLEGLTVKELQSTRLLPIDLARPHNLVWSLDSTTQ